MAVWAIGDIQGCYASLRGLLKKIDFNPSEDTLWVAGDLVNRGEGSLETLEYLYSIRDSVKIVLGNHDITLIGVYYGIKPSNPTLDPILASPQCKVLIEWLGSQPFLQCDENLGYCMVHAGISPQFDLDSAKHYAEVLSQRLQSEEVVPWLGEMFEGKISLFSDALSPLDKERYAISAFTRMRFCDASYSLNFKEKGNVTEALSQEGWMPWFEVPKRLDIGMKIIFGHWSTLGFYEDDKVLGLDTGCLWGRELTAARIDSAKVTLVAYRCEGNK